MGNTEDNTENNNIAVVNSLLQKAEKAHTADEAGTYASAALDAAHTISLMFQYRNQ